ncbi:MANSC domain-containing protein 4 isoform X1 [Oreochromis aureus]|uniref:MANSC domain-containing protein n=1 Tax=Oreochromis aureus TaxID=47969 RepID=A0AAZ1Y1X7_OREAU|nr:MANSC domain-containing protein 4 isoform X1 [Oreochromis aureus]
MNAACGLLAVFSLVCRVESRCSPTSYYKNCWIRRFPGIFIDIEESQRRGAQLLKHYQEETALKCSRTCCLTRNFSCNLAIFHYDTTQEILNCFHLHCPTLESCILSHRDNVVLYNITKGVDPDLLVFGKYFTSNVRVLPHHYSRNNASEPLLSDKRQFIHPPPPIKPSTTAGRVHATTEASVIATTALQSTGQPLAVSTTTTAVPSTEKTPPSSKKYAQTTAAVVSTTSLPGSITTPPSFTTVSTLGHYNSKILSAFSTTSPQSPVSTPTRHHTATFSQLASSPPTSAALISYTESSKLYLNETKGNHGRNHTVSNEGASGDDTLPGLGHGWYVAADTLLVAVAICITVLLSCCCSILLVVSWRGQRKRMGRYSTSWRGKRGSMRLIKYVLVKESS